MERAPHFVPVGKQIESALPQFETAHFYQICMM